MKTSNPCRYDIVKELKTFGEGVTLEYVGKLILIHIDSERRMQYVKSIIGRHIAFEILSFRDHSLGYYTIAIKEK